MNEQLAKVNRADLGFEDHNIFGVNIDFNYGGSGQGTGWYSLKGEWGTEFLKRTLQACSVREWKDLPGRQVYVIRSSDDWDAKVVGIKPLPFDKGKEFLFSDLDNLK